MKVSLPLELTNLLSSSTHNIPAILDFYSSAVKVVISVSGNFHKIIINGISWTGYFCDFAQFLCHCHLWAARSYFNSVWIASNIHVVYAPTGCTGELQPLDQLVLKTQTCKKDHVTAQVQIHHIKILSLIKEVVY